MCHVRMLAFDNTKIDTLLSLIKTTDFSGFEYESVAETPNEAMARALTNLYQDFLNIASRHHPLVKLALEEVLNKCIRLYPLSKLKKIGSLLVFAEQQGEVIFNQYLRRLAGHKYLHQTLFELQIGHQLKKYDAEIEYCEHKEKPADYPPDFRKGLNGDAMWFEAYVRDRDKHFFDHFEYAESHRVIPKPEAVIEELLRGCAKTTRRKIRAKRKKGIPSSKTFVTFVCPLDHYSSGHVNYQEFVNTLN